MTDRPRDPESSGPKQPAQVPDTTPPPSPQSAGDAPHKATDKLAKAKGEKSEHGGYRILQPLAKGGMGRLSLAEDQQLKRQVVIKEIRESLVEDRSARGRFVAEARITGQLEHPGVVPVYALGVDRHGQPFYAMRRVQGDTLKDTIAKHHAQPSAASLRELLRRFVAVCQTMAYAHARGVIHRDLKPANVMVGAFGETLVLDWGLAKAAAAASPESTIGDLAERMLEDRPEPTLAGAKMGSPPYMSPEQAEGRAFAVGPAADIYALGAILYDILTGQPPYSGKSSAEVIQKVRSTTPPKPSDIFPGVPRPLEAICLKAMARTDTGRYPDALTLASDVQNWLDDERVSVYRESVTESAWRWVRHHRTIVACSIVASISIFAAVTIGTLITQGERVRRAAAERLAAENSRRAKEAEKTAAEKERQAKQRSKEAADARQEAVEALKLCASIEREKGALLAQIAELETGIKEETIEAERLQGQLDPLRAQLAVKEQELTGALEKARLAKERADSLVNEMEQLRREAADLRQLIQKEGVAAPLSEEAVAGASNEAAVTELLEDLTEGNAAMFDVESSDSAFCLLSDNSARHAAGAYSLQVDSLSSGEVWVTYPANRSANWDLSTHNHLRFAYCAEKGAEISSEKIWVRLGRGSSYFECRADDARRRPVNESWLEAMFPLAGVPGKLAEANHPDLAHIDWIEIHVAASQGVTVWLDALSLSKTPPLAVSPFSASEARFYQETWAQYLRAPVEFTNAIGMTFTLIPPGEFNLGADQQEIAELVQAEVQRRRTRTYAGRNANWHDRIRSEGPRRRVRIDRPFYLSKYEVTVAQFREFVNATGHQTDAERSGRGGEGIVLDSRRWEPRPENTWKNPGYPQEENHPVSQVTLNDAREFCLWLSEQERVECVPPREDEWEYACRAGTVTRYCCGDNVETLQATANIRDEAYRQKYDWLESAPWNDGYAMTSPVGQFAPNAFGLYDMHGNVWEMCRLWPSSADRDQPPGASDRFALPVCAARGGSFHALPDHGRSASRYVSDRQDLCNFCAGFRPRRACPEAADEKNRP